MFLLEMIRFKYNYTDFALVHVQLGMAKRMLTYFIHGQHIS